MNEIVKIEKVMYNEIFKLQALECHRKQMIASPL